MGSALRSDATTSQHNERARGQRNERMTIGNARTSWCNKTRGGRHNERIRRGDRTTSWCDKTTRGAAQQYDDKRQCNNQLVQREGKWAAQREAVQGNKRRDGGMTRGNATTSQHKFS